MRLIYVTYRAGPHGSQTIYQERAATIVRESRPQISFLFGFLTAASAVALGRVVSSAATTAGRVAGAVVFGGLAMVFIAGWIVASRRPGRLEITDDAVRYVPRKGQVCVLSRQHGDELRWVRQLRGRVWRLGLTIAGTDTVVFLGTFPRKTVRQACLARGWRFDDRAIIQR